MTRECFCKRGGEVLHQLIQSVWFVRRAGFFWGLALLIVFFSLVFVVVVLVVVFVLDK